MVTEQQQKVMGDKKSFIEEANKGRDVLRGHWLSLDSQTQDDLLDYQNLFLLTQNLTYYVAKEVNNIKQAVDILLFMADCGFSFYKDKASHQGQSNLLHYIAAIRPEIIKPIILSISSDIVDPRVKDVNGHSLLWHVINKGKEKTELRKDLATFLLALPYSKDLNEIRRQGFLKEVRKDWNNNESKPDFEQCNLEIKNYTENNIIAKDESLKEIEQDDGPVFRQQKIQFFGQQGSDLFIERMVELYDANALFKIYKDYKAANDKESSGAQLEENMEVYALAICADLILSFSDYETIKNFSYTSKILNERSRPILQAGACK